MKALARETFASPFWWFTSLVMALLIDYFTPDLRAWDATRAKQSAARRAKLVGALVREVA